MASRLELHERLKTKCDNVYYQPPVGTKMTYPAIRYSRSKIDSIYADDDRYRNMFCYEVIVIDRNPDSPIVDDILCMPMCRHERHYTSDGLNHDVFKIYW